MRSLRVWLMRALGAFARRRQDRELADELANHVELQVADNLRTGMTPDQARRHALMKLGGIYVTAESYRDRRLGPFVQTVMNVITDTKFGLRMLLKQPGPGIGAIISLAIGIGLTTTMLTIVYAVALRGLPYERPERLVALFESRPAQNLQFLSVDLHDLIDWREQQNSFEDIAPYFGGTVSVSGTEGPPVRYQGAVVAAGLFDLLRVRPILGRTFLPGEAAPSSAARVMIVSYRVWQGRFGGDPGIVGRLVRANSEIQTIVGVMPEGFDFPGQTDAWLPFQLDPATQPRGGGRLYERWQNQAIARLSDGVTVEAAQTRMSAIAARLAAAYPTSNKGLDVRIMPLVDMSVGPQVKVTLATMLVAVFGVLLIACANVANLLLVRAASRSKEIAVRVALGSSRFRIIVQLLIESLILALAGATAGLMIAAIGIGFFNASIVVVGAPTWFVARFDPPVIATVIGLAFLSALLAGTVPALRASRTDVMDALNDESRASSGLRIGRISRMLVIVEIALSCGLLIEAGRLIRTIVNVTRIDYGFQTSGVFTARIGLMPKEYATPAVRWRFFTRAIEAVKSLPGVQDVAFSSDLPAHGGQMWRLSIEGAAYVTEQEHPRSMRVVVTPKFFGMFNVKPIRGRLLTETDVADSAPVAVVNERFVELFLQKGDPLGQRIRVGDDAEPWRTVVGVVPNANLGGVIESINARHEGAFIPLAQNTIGFVNLLVRTERAPMTYAHSIQSQINTVDPNLPLYWVRALDDLYHMDTWAYRTFGTLFVAFGLGALVLATLGLYGVMSFAAKLRTREVGIRMALGAQRGSVLVMVIRQGAVQVIAGLMFGLGLAALIGRGLSALIVNVTFWDPFVLSSVLVIMGVTGIVATIIPARRAASVDPLQALRHE